MNVPTWKELVEKYPYLEDAPRDLVAEHCFLIGARAGNLEALREFRDLYEGISKPAERAGVVK